MERPADPVRVRETDLILFETVWDQYFYPLVKQRNLTKEEILRAKLIFLQTCANRKARGWSARQMIESAQNLVAPYIKKRGWSEYTSNGVLRCDYCGRPHTTEHSQCPGCGVWRRQYR